MARRSKGVTARRTTAGPAATATSAPRAVLNAETPIPRKPTHLPSVAVRLSVTVVAPVTAETRTGALPDTPGVRDAVPARPHGEVEVVTGLATAAVLTTRTGALLGPVITEILEVMKPLRLVASHARTHRRTAGPATATLKAVARPSCTAAAVRETAAELPEPVPTPQAIAGSLTETQDLDPPAGDEPPKAAALKRTAALARLPKAPEGPA